MIATLSGVIAEKIRGEVVLDVNGVGYGVLMPLDDFTSLKVGSNAKIYIYEHIREAVHDLYGFTELENLGLFELLLSVNGIGPKMALSILGLGKSDDVRLAIAEGNLKFIQSAAGVGKRVAERLVVDLKDKVGLVAGDAATTFLQVPSANTSDEAVQGLMALGYTPQDAMQALDGIDKKLETTERIKLALRGK